MEEFLFSDQQIVVFRGVEYRTSIDLERLSEVVDFMNAVGIQVAYYSGTIELHYGDCFCIVAQRPLLWYRVAVAQQAVRRRTEHQFTTPWRYNAYKHLVCDMNHDAWQAFLWYVFNVRIGMNIYRLSSGMLQMDYPCRQQTIRDTNGLLLMELKNALAFALPSDICCIVTNYVCPLEYHFERRCELVNMAIWGQPRPIDGRGLITDKEAFYGPAAAKMNRCIVERPWRLLSTSSAA